jgi:ketosteroid isomerase-like protein
VLANAEAKWAVLRAIEELLDHIGNGRLPETIAAFTMDDDVAMYGSETGEAAVGPDQLRQFFADIYARPYRVLFTLGKCSISVAGHVAWFTGDGSYRLSTGDEPHPYRLTGVLERRRDRWLWQLFSGSEPLARP